jgi:hypothetical protein
MPITDNGPTLLTVLCCRIPSAISGTCRVRCTYIKFDALIVAIFLARHHRLRRFSLQQASPIHSAYCIPSTDFRTAQIRCIFWLFRRLDRCHIPRSPLPTSEVFFAAGFVHSRHSPYPSLATPESGGSFQRLTAISVASLLSHSPL